MTVPVYVWDCVCRRFAELRYGPALLAVAASLGPLVAARQTGQPTPEWAAPASLYRAAPAPQVPVVTARVSSEMAGIGAEPFGRLGGVGLGPGGSVLAVDRMPSRLHHIGRGGTHIKTVGQEGNGPGDLATPCCPEVMPDGALWVVGLGGRLDRFSLEGGLPFLSRMTLRGGPSGTPISPFGIALLPEGRVRLIASVRPRRGLFERDILEFDSTGVFVKALKVPHPPPDSIGIVTFRTRSGELISERTVPFAPYYILRLARDGSYIRIVPSAYTIHHYEPSGALRRTIRLTVHPRPFTSQERDSVQRFAAAMRGVATQYGFQLLSLPEPRARPVIADAWFDDDQRLWVQTDTAGPGTSVADVYSDKGVLLFRARWNADISLRNGAIKGFSGWGIRTSDMGEHSLVEVQFR